MRFLNKFYSFIKSVYLNNSKYSNNLRHTLRIFFEREVKTKHTPTMFGSTFKGSKWVDYNTFNINRLLIKSGLSYFYYIALSLSFLFILLGRSKAEQYFGFLPFFAYINFFLGYIPLMLSDLISQVIFVTYLIYTLIIKFLYRACDTVISKNFLFLEKNIPTKFNANSVKSVKNCETLSALNYSASSVIPFLPKQIFSVQQKLLYLTPDYTIKYTPLSYLLTNQTSILKLRDSISSKFRTKLTVTEQESKYLGLSNLNNFKVHNKVFSLNENNNFFRTINYPNNFNFNLQNNLNVSKQQRWLAKNSLLTESIMSNSFLITQSKKLIGLGFLDKDFASKTLWIPSKSTNLSAKESHNYFNNITNHLFTQNSISNFNYSNKNTAHHFNFLNFFENSRLFLVKKYFFTTNQQKNLIVEYPKMYTDTVISNKSSAPLNLTFNVNLYYSNIVSLLTNNFIPSTNPKNNMLHTTTYNHLSKTSNFDNVAVGTAQLDILSGNNANLIYLITSNTQYVSNTNYFNLLTTPPTNLTNSASSVSHIKFSI